MIELDDKWFVVIKDGVYEVPALCYETQEEALEVSATIKSDRFDVVDFKTLNNLIQSNNYRLYY